MSAELNHGFRLLKLYERRAVEKSVSADEAMAICHGLRVSELCSLTWDQFDFSKA